MYKIAIDGPSGSGKSTLAKNLSRALGFIYVDTGAMYRTVALATVREGITDPDPSGMSELLAKTDVKVVYENGRQKELLNGEDVSDLIRTPEISSMASKTSALPCVREYLLGVQRDFAAHYDVIMDGRDIGTVIMPDADVKIFMASNDRERAQRRYEELRLSGQDVTFDEIYRLMLERDARDKSRETAPCVPAEDAVFLDNSTYTPDETLIKALEIVKSKLK